MPTRTLPDILTAAGVVGPVDLLKCDIEGSERELFADPERWIGRVKHVLIELHLPYDETEFLARVREADTGFIAERFKSRGENPVILLARRTM